jgi:hypothetical protein
MLDVVQHTFPYNPYMPSITGQPLSDLHSYLIVRDQANSAGDNKKIYNKNCDRAGTYVELVPRDSDLKMIPLARTTATVTDRPVLSSERAPHINKPATV